MNPLKDVLRETAELKKLNAGLMKTTEIDDLLGDVYGMIWREIGTKLKNAAVKQEPTASAPVLVSPPRPDSRNIMSLANLMHVDGASDIRPSSAHYASNSQLFSPYTSRPATPPSHPTPSAALIPLHELTPSKPKSRVISRREMIKRASDTVASLKPTASTVAAAAAANKTGSPPPPDSVGRRSRRGAEVEDTSASIVMETGADSDDGEGEGEGGKASATASREGDALEHEGDGNDVDERDGNDADDEIGSDLSADEEGDEGGDDRRMRAEEDVVMDGGEREKGGGTSTVVVGARTSGGFSGANSNVDV